MGSGSQESHECCIFCINSIYKRSRLQPYKEAKKHCLLLSKRQSFHMKRREVKRVPHHQTFRPTNPTLLQSLKQLRSAPSITASVITVISPCFSPRKAWFGTHLSLDTTAQRKFHLHYSIQYTISSPLAQHRETAHNPFSSTSGSFGRAHGRFQS